MNDKRGKYLLFAIDHPLPFAGGGAGQMALKLARALNLQNFPIRIVMPATDAKYILNKRSEDALTIPIPMPQHIPEPIFSLLYNWRLAVFLSRQRKKLTGIHLHGLRGIFTLVLMARILKLPFYVTVLSPHNWSNFYQTSPANIYRRFIRNLLDPHIYVALNKHMKKRMLSDGVKKDHIRLIPNGSDVPEHKLDRVCQRRELGLPLDQFLVVYAGRLHPQKNILFLLRIWRIFIRQHNRSHLILLGDGPQAQIIKNYLIQHDLTRTIFLKGYVKRVTSFMQAADIFVLPSKSEGCSNALLEAMAHGLTCLASASSGNDELICDGKNGYLLPFGQPDLWAQRLHALAVDPAQREGLGREARQTVAGHFSLDRCMQRHIQMYHDSMTSSIDERASE